MVFDVREIYLNLTGNPNAGWSRSQRWWPASQTSRLERSRYYDLTAHIPIGHGVGLIP